MGLIPEWYDENMSIVALMGTCITPNTKYFGNLYTPEVWNCLQSNNIYAIADPNWEANKATIMSDPACPQSFKDQLSYYESLLNNPIQAVAAYAQTAYTGRF